MPLFPTSEEWLRQSTLLLQARPTTTRITTKYTLPNASSAKIAKKRARKPVSTEAKATEDDKPTTTAPVAYLELKTYDPESGVTLKYRTDKGAEVGRLIASLGRLGRCMAALPEVKEDVVMADAEKEEAEQAPEEKTQVPAPTQSGTGGGKGKKKKGKR